MKRKLLDFTILVILITAIAALGVSTQAYAIDSDTMTSEYEGEDSKTNP